MTLRARAVEFEGLYSNAEFEAMPEFGERYGLIEGRLVKKPVPGYEHAHIAQRINRRLTLFDPDEKLGIIAQEVNTNIGPKDTPLPDLSFWIASRKPKMTKGAAPRPDLVVEVLSPHDLDSRKRREEAQAKIRRYQAAGVSVVWLINPQSRQVEIYHPGELEPVKVLYMTDQLEGEPVIPGFTMPIADLFA